MAEDFFESKMKNLVFRSVTASLLQNVELMVCFEEIHQIRNFMDV